MPHGAGGDLLGSTFEVRAAPRSVLLDGIIEERVDSLEQVGGAFRLSATAQRP